jgi:hypothetical protein
VGEPMKCAFCKNEREIHAHVYLKVADKEVEAAACKECFSSSMKELAMFKGMANHLQIPADWQGVLFNG